jgi:hypothetical protein
MRASLLQRSSAWRAAVERTRRLSGRRTEDVGEVTRLVDDYRLLAHDLARARRLMPNSRAREFLEGAYAQAHAILHRNASHPGFALWSLFRDQVPAAVSWLRPHIIWVTLLFVLSILAGGWLVDSGEVAALRIKTRCGQPAPFQRQQKRGHAGQGRERPYAKKGQPQNDRSQDESREQTST